MINSILGNRWVQWILIGILFSVLKGVYTGITGVEIYPTERPLTLLKNRDWVRTMYFFMDDIGNLVEGAYLLRAAGLIEFLKWGE